MGHRVSVFSPDQFRSVPCPTYAEIRLDIDACRTVGERIAAFRPDAMHIATEGPLCFAHDAGACERGVPFTTAYHTQFPEYMARRTGMPARLIWPLYAMVS